MTGPDEVSRAWAYTRGVARVIGVNLPAAVQNGQISRDRLDDLVQTCTHCRFAAGCTDWLAHTVKADHPPGFCPIAQTIEALKP